MTDIKYPHIKVQLTGRNGLEARGCIGLVVQRCQNAFSIISAVDSAMRRAGVHMDEREAFRKEATSSDYDNVIQTAMRWVDVS